MCVSVWWLDWFSCIGSCILLALDLFSCLLSLHIFSSLSLQFVNYHAMLCKHCTCYRPLLLCRVCGLCLRLYGTIRTYGTEHYQDMSIAYDESIQSLYTYTHTHGLPGHTQVFTIGWCRGVTAKHPVSTFVSSTVMTSFIGSGTELQHSLTNAYHVLFACPASVCRVRPDSRVRLRVW